MHKTTAAIAVLFLVTQCNGTETDNPAPTQALPEVARSTLVYDAAPSVTAVAQQALLGDLNGFGLKVFQRLAPSEENFVSSPASGFIALTMTSAGAQGATAEAMKAVLYPNVPLGEIHAATNQLQQRIRGYARPASADGEKKVELGLVNDDFVQKDFAIGGTFLDTLAVNYDCGVELVDYAGAPDTARALINNWVAKRTSERIQELLSPGAVDNYTRLVLANAFYLESSWLTAFDPNQTHARTFHGVRGDASTDFVSAQGLSLGYATGAGWVGVDVPYYGDSLVWTAVVPDAGQFETVKATLDATWLANFDAAAQSQQLDLAIPKFQLKGLTVAWNQALTDLGMTTLFDPASANLEGISAIKPLYVKAVLQQVTFALGEAGTEAAAATGVIINADAGVSPPAPVSVLLDRPFLFLIRERGGPVLFVGQIVSLPVAN